MQLLNYLKEFTMDMTIFRSDFTNGFRGTIWMFYLLILVTNLSVYKLALWWMKVGHLSVEQNEYWPSFEVKVLYDS